MAFTRTEVNGKIVFEPVFEAGPPTLPEGEVSREQIAKALQKSDVSQGVTVTGGQQETKAAQKGSAAVYEILTGASFEPIVPTIGRVIGDTRGLKPYFPGLEAGLGFQTDYLPVIRAEDIPGDLSAAETVEWIGATVEPTEGPPALSPFERGVPFGEFFSETLRERAERTREVFQERIIDRAAGFGEEGLLDKAGLDISDKAVLVLGLVAVIILGKK